MLLHGNVHRDGSEEIFTGIFRCSSCESPLNMLAATLSSFGNSERNWQHRKQLKSCGFSFNRTSCKGWRRRNEKIWNQFPVAQLPFLHQFHVFSLWSFSFPKSLLHCYCYSSSSPYSPLHLLVTFLQIIFRPQH